MTTKTLPKTVPTKKVVTKKVTTKTATAKKSIVPKPIVAITKKPVAVNPISVAVKQKQDKPLKHAKHKLVRDSFTIPKDEYQVLADLKVRMTKLMQPVKKSELLRAGLKTLASMSDAAIKKAMSNVPAIKTGRPAKIIKK